MMMAELKKRDVEHLLGNYDTNPRDAILSSLRIVFDDAQLSWFEALKRLPLQWNHDAIGVLDNDACDLLVKHLVEHRTLEKI